MFKCLCFQYLRKLNRQERVVEEVKLAIKPYYAKGRINKDEYKDIMRKAVPKVTFRLNIHLARYAMLM